VQDRSVKFVLITNWKSHMSFRLVPNSVTSGHSRNVGHKSSFSDISFMAILAGDHPSESVKARHSALASKNLTNNQP